eukprot:52378-Prorocentrum_lima.AAC.1
MRAYTVNIKTYSGTATKWSQRAVNAYAVQMNNMLFSIDISAFLKGMTFQEIASETGDNLRS